MQTEAEHYLMTIIKKCRMSPLHDHFVYCCPEVLDVLSKFGELKEAEGALQVRRQIPCAVANERCVTCWACDAMLKAERLVGDLKARMELLVSPEERAT